MALDRPRSSETPDHGPSLKLLQDAMSTVRTPLHPRAAGLNPPAPGAIENPGNKPTQPSDKPSAPTPTPIENPNPPKQNPPVENPNPPKQNPPVENPNPPKQNPPVENPNPPKQKPPVENPNPPKNPVENPNPPSNPQQHHPYSAPGHFILPNPPRGDAPPPPHHPPVQKTPDVPVKPEIPVVPPVVPPPHVPPLEPPPPIPKIPTVPEQHTPVVPPIVPPVVPHPDKPHGDIPPPVVPPPVVPPVHVPPHTPLHPPPTGVFTGQGGVHSKSESEQAYNVLYSAGKQASAHHMHLISEALGQTDAAGKRTALHVDIDMVGTGKDMGLKKHQTEMVAPRDPFHAGEWKYSDPEKTGKTIIAAHVSYNHKPGPFYDLHNLGIHNGVRDQVSIEGADGKKTTYEFTGREVIKNPQDQKVWDRVFAPGDPKHKELELLTCAGPVVHGVHKWRLIDHLREVQPKDAGHTDKAMKPLAPTDAAKASAGDGNVTSPPGSSSTPRGRETLPPSAAHIESGKPATLAPVPTVDASGTRGDAQSTKQEIPPAHTAVTAPDIAPAVKAAPAPEHSPVASENVPAHSVAAPVTVPADLPASSAPAKIEHSPLNSFDAVTTSAPGSAPQTRLIFDHQFAHPHGSLTGASLELGGTIQDGKVSYLTAGPNFTFLNNNRDIVRGNLKLGYGMSDFVSADFSHRGLDRWSVSSQFDATHRLGTGTSRLRDTSAYLAAGLSIGTNGSQELLEGGLEQYVGKNLLLRVGVHGAKYKDAPVGGYGVFGAAYSTGNFFIGVTAEQPLNPQPGQSKRATGFLTIWGKF